MSTYVFPIATLNTLVSQYAIAIGQWAKYTSRGLNSVNDICTIQAARQILITLYNNVPASLQGEIEYDLYPVPFNGTLTPPQLQCLFSKLTEFINSLSGPIPPIYPPTNLQWTAGSNIEWHSGETIEWHG